MAYGVKYSAEFDNVTEARYKVEILLKDYVGSVLPIEFSGVPVRHGWQTDEPKAAIKGSFLTLTLYNGGALPITDFYAEEDDAFKCKYYKGAQLLFEGFLVQDDCNELMADYKHDITLSFNDNLGLLKDVPLDIALERLPLLEIIAPCIQNTGLELDTYVYANIFETTFVTTDSFLAQTYIDTQTFIKGETFDNCFDVLTSILDRFNLSLFQAMGAWRIVRWDEIRYDPNVPYFRYDSTFTLIDDGTMDASFMTGFQQAIYPETGLTRSIFRPFKYSKETFNYVQPKYLLRNFDLLDLGSLQTSYTSGSDTIYEYDFTDWSASGFGGAPNFFIRVVTDTATGDEKDRYAVIEGATGDNPRSVAATPFEVNEGDRLTFQFTYKTTKSQVGPGTTIVAIRLYDGTTTQYATGDPGTGWKTGLGWVYAIASGDDTANSQSVSITTGKIPYTGLIYIYLPHADLTAGAGDETQIKDIRVTYTPYINDSTKVIGHTHTYEQNKIIKNNEDVEIFLDDTPRNSIIGTLFRSTSTGLLQDRTTYWYRLSNPSEELRIGEITTLEQLFWRRKPRTKLEGTFYGVSGNGITYSYTGSMDFYMLTSPDRYAINVPAIPVNTVRIGDVLVITNSASNDGTYTVTGFGTGVGFPLNSFIVDGPITTSPGDNATISVYSAFDISMLTVLKNLAVTDARFIFGSLEIDYKNNNFSCTMWEIFEDGEDDGDLTATYNFNYLYESK